MHFAPEMSRMLGRRVGEFDVAHLHSVFLWPTAAAARAAEGKGVPYVVSPRGMLVKELVRRRSRIAKEAWIRLVERRTIEGAAAVHVTSSMELRELRRFGLRLPRVESIPNGVSPPCEALPLPRVPARDVLFLGRLEGKKRVDLLLRAIAAVPGVSATIAGPDDGERSALIALRDRLGLGDTVEIRGPAYGDDKAALLCHHKLLAITSIQENFGNVVTEAMSHGLPVVATDRVGAAELLVRHQAGVVCEGEVTAVSTAIRQVLFDDDLREAMGHRARSASRRYSWDRIAASFESCYTRAARAGRAGWSLG